LILLETNILLRYARATDPRFATVDTAIGAMRSNGDVICVVPQVIYEFWAAATRPVAANGLGLTVADGHHSERERSRCGSGVLVAIQRRRSQSPLDVLDRFTTWFLEPLLEESLELLATTQFLDFTIERIGRLEEKIAPFLASNDHALPGRQFQDLVNRERLAP